MPRKKEDQNEKDQAFQECAAALMRMRNAIEDFRAAYSKMDETDMSKMGLVIATYSPEIDDTSSVSIIGHNVICRGLVGRLNDEMTDKRSMMNRDSMRAEGSVKEMLNGLFRPGKDK